MPSIMCSPEHVSGLLIGQWSQWVSVSSALRMCEVQEADSVPTSAMQRTFPMYEQLQTLSFVRCAGVSKGAIPERSSHMHEGSSYGIAPRYRCDGTRTLGVVILGEDAHVGDKGR
jgi:hypothetical protein